jgi:ABC-type proline/glycine betaine transport system permease subunit
MAGLDIRVRAINMDQYDNAAPGFGMTETRGYWRVEACLACGYQNV